MALRNFATKTLGALRTGWLIIGVWLVLLLLIETCFRVKDAVKSASATPRAASAIPGDPAADPWFADFTREYDETRAQRWIPYVQFGRKPGYKGRYIEIDSVGHRVVPQPSSATAPVATVFMFGGSTMWGDSQRGEHNISGETSRRLQEMVAPGGHISVTNFGESGYVSTQEIIQLELELQMGHRPDVVVFYDGLNDVASTVQMGIAGSPQNESKRVTEFNMGRALDRTGFARGTAKDARAVGLLAVQTLRQFQLTDWILSHKNAPNTNYIAADSAARSTVRAYVHNVQMVEALAARFGFKAVYIWQPNLHASEKKLNPFEQRLRARIERDPFHSRIQQTHRILPPMLDSAMKDVAPGRFIDAAALFRGDTLAVYTDWLGHNTEGSIPHIVDAFWPVLQEQVRTVLSQKSNTPAPAAARPPTR